MATPTTSSSHAATPSGSQDLNEVADAGVRAGGSELVRTDAAPSANESEGMESEHSRNDTTDAPHGERIREMAGGVEVVTSELVAPSEPTPRRALWLSNLDLAARNGYTPTVYFFRQPPAGAGDGFFSADVLRAALARALVSFYPFAGRLAKGTDGRTEIDCNDEGALFVVARSAAALDEYYEGFTPCNNMCDMFFPKCDNSGSGGAPLLMIQVTLFRCGGVVLGTSMHHFVMDGHSAFHFTRTWTSLARGEPTSAIAPPSLDRTPLRARLPPTILFDHTREYGSLAASSPPVGENKEYASAILQVTAAQVDALRARAGGAHVVSAFRALAAHVWRCVCAARALPHDAESRLYTNIDMRARLAPPLPAHYLGNVVVRASVSARVSELLFPDHGDGLAFAARRLRAVTGLGDAYARSLVDYLETMDPEALRGGITGADLRVISWLGMRSDDVDFGWGKPALLSPARVYYTGSVYLLNSPGEDGDITVVVALEPDRIDRFKQLFFEELKAVLE